GRAGEEHPAAGPGRAAGRAGGDRALRRVPGFRRFELHHRLDADRERRSIHDLTAAPMAGGGFAGRSAATLIGFTAVLMRSSLALLTASSGQVPPFQLAAISFAIGGALGAATWVVRRHAVHALRQPPEVWALGVGGLFGYHALYFTALRLAPPAEAGLINYLWPLLIVLLSGLLPGERLRAVHVIGALLGFAGLVALASGRGGLDLDT